MNTELLCEGHRHLGLSCRGLGSGFLSRRRFSRRRGGLLLGRALRGRLRGLRLLGLALVIAGLLRSRGRGRGLLGGRGFDGGGLGGLILIITTGGGGRGIYGLLGGDLVEVGAGDAGAVGGMDDYAAVADEGDVVRVEGGEQVVEAAYG